MTKRIFSLSVAAVLALGAPLAFAQEKKAAAAPQAAAPQHANVAMCIGCHGIPGYKTAYPIVYHVPKIAGQQPGYIIAALKAYKSGERSHPSMRGIAASLSDEQMQKLAEYYGAPAK